MGGDPEEFEAGNRDGWPRQAIRLGGVATTLAIAAMLWWFWDQEAFEGWKSQAHPLLFFALMAVLPALGFPVTPFYLLAGATFGTATGLLGTWLALSVNLVICYQLSHSGLRPTLIRWLTRAGLRMPGIAPENELRFTLLVKLAPVVPAFAKNYFLGLTGIRFGIYFPISLAVTGIYATCFVVMGESFLEHKPWKAGIMLALLLLIAGGVAAWRRWKS